MKLLLTLALFAFSALSQCQTICIDPGHPSENGVGTHGKNISELRAAWKVGEKLRDILVRDGYRVVMTKNTENEKVTNKRRAEIANEAHAALMIRLHCDAGSRPGFASYYPAKVGTVGGVTGPSKDVLLGSRRVANLFHPAVIEALNGDMADRGLHTDSDTMIGGKQGGALTGSIYSKVPAILVEMAVLQNAHDDLFISTEEGQQRISAAIAKGVEAAVPKRGEEVPAPRPRPSVHIDNAQRFLELVNGHAP